MGPDGLALPLPLGGESRSRPTVAWQPVGDRKGTARWSRWTPRSSGDLPRLSCTLCGRLKGPPAGQWSAPQGRCSAGKIGEPHWGRARGGAARPHSLPCFPGDLPGLCQEGKGRL